MASEGSQPNPFHDDEEFQRITEQLAYDDEAAAIAAGQAHHDAQTAEQQAYDNAFQRVVDPNGLNALDALGQMITTSTQSLRDQGEIAAMDVLNPDPNDDETLTRLAEREKKIRAWTAEAVDQFGDDPEEAEARYRKMWADADQQLAENVRARYQQGAEFIESLGAKTVVELTPRENRMRGLIRRSRSFVGRIFGLGS